MQLKLNRDVCIGCGMCVAMCDKLFAFRDGKADVIKQPETDAEMSCAKDAVEGCCVSAISIEEGYIVSDISIEE